MRRAGWAGPWTMYLAFIPAVSSIHGADLALRDSKIKENKEEVTNESCNLTLSSYR